MYNSSRTLCLIIAVLIEVFAMIETHAQADFETFPRDPLTKRIRYKESIQMPGVNAHQLYLRAKTWKFNKLKEGHYILDNQVSTKVKVVAEPFEFIHVDLKGKQAKTRFFYLVTITISPHAYQYTISDLFVGSNPGKKQGIRLKKERAERIIFKDISKSKEYEKRLIQSYRQEVHRVISQLIIELKNAMATPREEGIDDW